MLACRRQARFYLLAARKRPAVEMKMIVMRGVEIGTQRNTEIAAGAGVYFMQETRFVIIALPMPLDGYSSAVVEFETGYVDSVGGGVLASGLAPEFAPDDITA